MNIENLNPANGSLVVIEHLDVEEAAGYPILRGGIPTSIHVISISRP